MASNFATYAQIEDRGVSKTRTRTSTPSLFARNPQRHLLRGEEWLPVARVASRLPTLAECLPLLPAVAHQWQLGAYQHSLARATARETGAQQAALGSRVGQPERQDGR